MVEGAMRAVMGDDAHKMKCLPLSLGRRHRTKKLRVAKKPPILDRAVYPDPVQKDAPAGAEMKVPRLGISDRMVGHADCFSGSLQNAVRELRPERVKVGGPGLADDIAVGFLPEPPSV